MTAPRDETFMRQALRQARKGLGRTAPNPAVGAVIVKEGQVIARGFHKQAGMPHAEVEALGGAGSRAQGATMYVTLEPCNHQGRTPPCTQAILRSGLSRVVVGMKDPNPDVKGGGIQALKEAGVETTCGVLEEACRQLNQAFICFVTRRRPFVTLKSALTLDGFTATAAGHSRWVTGERARREVHRLRDQHDAVMVGVGTVLADDPRLTVRLKHRPERQPLRVVADTHLRTPPEAFLVRTAREVPSVILHGLNADAQRAAALARAGVILKAVPLKDGRLDLSSALSELAGMDVMSVLVEGGAALSGALIRERLVDRFLVFKALKLLGGGDGVPMAAGPGPGRMDECLVLKDIRVRHMGPDLLISGYPAYEEDPADGQP